MFFPDYKCSNFKSAINFTVFFALPILFITACSSIDKSISDADDNHDKKNGQTDLSTPQNTGVEFWNDTTEFARKKDTTTGIVYIFADNKWQATDLKTEIPENAVDYSLGRAMNTRLGKGINLGESWDSDGDDDSGWGNPIRDNDFVVIKKAGFNSVRIPVRWQKNSNYSTHTVDPTRLQGVMEDIQLAIQNDLAVIVSFQNYTEINSAGGASNRPYNADDFAKEKTHFLGLWAQIASQLNIYPDNMLVFEILSEPLIPDATLVDELMNDAYKVIRENAPGKTIMFESYHAAKFSELPTLHLPQDGNIIYSGHYYEPYEYTHQGIGYDCTGGDTYRNTSTNDFKEYVKIAAIYYPDINGKMIPINLGEFGVNGGDESPCKDSRHPSNDGKASWAKKTAKSAIENDMSFHYWGFGRTRGFDAYNVSEETWYPGFPAALVF